MQVLRIACRASRLSQAQFAEFSALFPEAAFSPLLIDSPGDRDKQSSLLDSTAPEDFFTRDLDSAVLEGQADAALHSAKDLPWPLPAGLALWWLGPGKDWDELASLPANNYTLESLPPAARVGTSSPARREGLLSVRPDLQIISIRGTIEERLAQLGPQLDALVVAACALRRLGLPAGTRLPFDAHPLQGRLALIGPLNNRRAARRFAAHSDKQNWGRVSIAGAGPGNPALLSRVVWDRLLTADVVFYDALLDQLLSDPAIRAEKVFVGKRAGKHSLRQEEINILLWQAALAGRRVLRLKGGDPLVLGRGSEEAEFLGRRLVSYELLPGISAAQTAASFAEIPLTERGRATSFAVISGYPPERFDPQKIDTKVFYMASSVLADIGNLSRSPGPIAAVSAAGGALQQVHLAPAEKAASLAPEDGNPVLYIAGPTVDARAGNGWFDRLPLVLYTGLSAGAWLEERAVHKPYIELRPFLAQQIADQPGGQNFLEGRLTQDCLVFTSRAAVQHCFTLWVTRGLDARALAGKCVAAIGASTASELRQHGIVADIVPPAGQDSSQGLAAQLAIAANQGRISSVLLPRSARGLDLLPRLLEEAGIETVQLHLYTTEPVNGASGPPEFYDEIVFSSPSTVESYKLQHPSIPEGVFVRLRGPQTAAAFAKHFSEHPEAGQR